MSYVCRAGHASDEPDYCSVCGAPVLPAGTSSRAAAPGGGKASPPAGACPSCGEPREDPDGRFCEVCRYDFTTGRPGSLARASRATPTPAPTATPEPPRAPTPAAPAPTTSLASAPATVAPTWEVLVVVDPSLDTEPDPASPCPQDAAPEVVSLDRPELLVGRRDERRAILPEVALGDPGASRRHAKLSVSPSGVVALHDLASMNGTSVNGVEVAAGSVNELKEHDQVTLGRWTRITLRRRA